LKSSSAGFARVFGNFRDLLQLPNDEVPYMAAFKVYCDESGKLADSKVVMFAGSVFLEDEVKAFNRKWSNILASAKIAYLKMSEAMSFGGEFKGWKDRSKDRDDVLEGFGKLLRESTIFHVVFTMDTAKFNSLDHKTRITLKNPIYAAFDGMIKALVAGTAQRRTPEDQFHLIYDLCDEYSERCLKLFDKIRTTHSPLKPLFPSLTFADDVDFPGLQAADIVAYCGKEEFKYGVGNCTGIIGRLLEISGSNDVEPGEVVFGTNDPTGSGRVSRLPARRGGK